MPHIRLGLIGLGKWCRQAYLPILQELPNADVVAVAAASKSTQAFARKEFGHGVTVYSDYVQLLSDSNVEAVFVALPNRLHAEAIGAAINSGKHVFFEPPVGLNRGQIERVLKIIRSDRQVIQPDLELRYLPVTSAIDQLLASDTIGRVLMAKIRLWCDWGFGGGDWDQNVEDEGFFLWLGCWYLDVLDVVFKAIPKLVSVSGGRAMNGRLLDHGWATLVYPDETLGQFEFSLVAGGGAEITLHVLGTNGEIEANLQNGMYRWRRDGKVWQTESRPSSQPAHGFVGMREAITHFVHLVQEDCCSNADIEACRRIHQTALMCHDAEASISTRAISQ